VIGGNVEPSRLAVDEKQVLFRRLIVPAHFPRAPKINGSGFHTNQSAVFRVALEKRCLQRLGRTISRLQAGNARLGVGAVWKSEKKKNQSVKVSTHTSSLSGHSREDRVKLSEKM